MERMGIKWGRLASELGTRKSVKVGFLQQNGRQEINEGLSPDEAARFCFDSNAKHP
jgi:hypothetical protein